MIQKRTVHIKLNIYIICIKKSNKVIMCSKDRGGMGGLIVKIGDFWSQASKPYWRMSQHVIPSLVLRFTDIYTETLVPHKRLQYLFGLSVPSPPPTELLLNVPFATIALTPLSTICLEVTIKIKCEFHDRGKNTLLKSLALNKRNKCEFHDRGKHTLLKSLALNN